jgi:rhodanese-related sulfurtransferase
MMTMNKLKLQMTMLVLIGGATLVNAAPGAIAPAELSNRIQSGEAITVIDVRATDFFQKGHIPGAISVPATILPQKGLPKLGRVVVYDAGLGEDLASGAVAALNAKPGITAQVLDGGLAGWESAKGETTADPGVTASQLPMISYGKLKSISGDYVIVDLRQPETPSKSAAGQPSQHADLSTEFPGASVVRDAFAVSSPRKAVNGVSAAPAPLLVLVDSGDGKAQEVGHTLKANGVRRFVILAGGEEMILRKGQSGSGRSGSSEIFTEAQISTLKQGGIPGTPTTPPAAKTQ